MKKPILIAGPCSLEGRIQAHEISNKCQELADKYRAQNGGLCSGAICTRNN